MSDASGRRTYDPADEGAGSGDRGWGSPVPAEYGALWPQRPPAPEETNGAHEPAPSPGGWSRRARRNRDGAEPGVARPADPEMTAAVAAAVVTRPGGAPIFAPPDGAVPVPPGPPTGFEPGVPTAVNPVYRAAPAYVGAPLAAEPALSRRQRKAARRSMRSRSRATVRHVDVLTVAGSRSSST